MPRKPVPENSRDEGVGPQKGEFIAPPEVVDADERADALPKQEEFWRPPVRFGSVPVEKEPLGWDRRRGFRKLFPRVALPFQVIERVAFGHPALEPNRLFWGDNLHVMRQLPSESIDLIYIDPPFFSGRNYNVIFGDQNELRSFSDIWEGGMPGYLVWLNARLYEMKRLLKKTGSIYVHLDWHAVHYVKVEMDKIFGHDCFRNEIIWKATNAHNDANRYGSIHQTLLLYTKTSKWTFNQTYQPYEDDYVEKYYRYTDENGRRFMSGDLAGAGAGPARRFGEKEIKPPPGRHWAYDQEGIDRLLREGRIFWTRNGVPRLKKYLDEMAGMPSQTLWADKGVQYIVSWTTESIGDPTQKAEALLERVIQASSNEGDVVADFFTGGGTTAAVAQRLGRRWIACDQSRVAVAITADRLTRQVEEQTGALFPVPDFTVEHWGIYEARRLADAPPEQFRAFVLRCFGAVPEAQSEPRPSGSGTESEPRPSGSGAATHAEDRSLTVAALIKGGGALIKGGAARIKADAARIKGAARNGNGGIHGYKGAVPVWVGGPDQKKGVTAKDVETFANAVRKTLRYQQDNLRDGIMLAWAFRPDAVEAAERLRKLEQTELNFIRLDMIRIDSPRFREHVTSLTTHHADYENFLTFVQPPRVEAGYKRIAPRTYKFDVSETAVLNPGAKIINLQWDFDYGKRFSSTAGYSFIRSKDKEPQLQVQYEFPAAGTFNVACKVQDDMGGEGLWTGEIEVQ